MRNKKYSQVGRKKEMPAYRTTSKFIYRSYLRTSKVKARKLKHKDGLET